RLQRIDDEGRRIRGPWDDVDLFALQFADDGLHARAAHADAGADRVDGAVVGQNRDLGARTGIAGGGIDLDHALIDCRLFLGEQPGHEFRLGARKEDLRALGLAAHVVNVGARAVADAKVFARNRFRFADDPFGAPQIDDDIVEFNAL